MRANEAASPRSSWSRRDFLRVSTSLGAMSVLASPALDSGAQGSYRLITTDVNANPFLGPPNAAYGGCKHVHWAWHPIKRRVYTYGGDYGVGAASFGQPSMGQEFTTNQPTGARTYQRDASLQSDQYSIDPYASDPVPWRLEQGYKYENVGGSPEPKPPRGCQVAMVWDSQRAKLWGILTSLRTEFYYRLADGRTPDIWANGETTLSPIEHTGTYSWLPGASGAPGVWTKETTARLLYRLGSTTFYSGDALVTGLGDERIGIWAYDPATDRILAWGNQAVFIFVPGTKTYEYRTISAPGYGYFGSSTSYVGIVGEWMYGVAITRTTLGVRKSQMIRVNIPRMLARANGASIPDTTADWEAIPLPWSLSTGNVWEVDGTLYAKVWEHAGVMGLGGKVVIVKSYSGLVEDGVTKLTTWDPATRVFTPAPTPPDTAIAANSWVALPDTGEVLMGQSTAGYSNVKLWAYTVSTGTPSLPPAAPTALQVR